MGGRVSIVELAGKEVETGLHLAVGAFDPGDQSRIDAAKEWLIASVEKAIQHGWLSDGEVAFALATRHRTSEFTGLDGFSGWASAVRRSRSRIDAWVTVGAAPGTLTIQLRDLGVQFPVTGNTIPIQCQVSWMMLGGQPDPLPSADSVIGLVSAAAVALHAVGGFVDTAGDAFVTYYEMDNGISPFGSLPKWDKVVRGPTWITLVTDRVAEQLSASGHPLEGAPVASMAELSDGDWHAWLCRLTPEPWRIADDTRQRWRQCLGPVLMSAAANR